MTNDELAGKIEDRTTGSIHEWLRRPENADLTRKEIEDGIYGGAWRRPVQRVLENRVTFSPSNTVGCASPPEGKVITSSVSFRRDLNGNMVEETQTGGEGK